jgi:hypothetical protein
MLLTLLLRPCFAELQPTFIRGTIYGAATGRPIPSATITTTTGLSFNVQNGFFYLRVPPNVYDLIVSAPGFRSNMATVIFSGPGQTAEVNVWLAPGSTTTGYLKGRVTATGGGLARALVFSDLGAIAVTDDDGYFTAAGPGGTATVTVAAQGYAGRIIKNVRIPPAGMSSLSIRLSKSNTGLTGPVSGSVRDACSGALLAGINITASNGSFEKTSNGVFNISAPAGKTSVLASAQGYQCSWQTAAMGILPVGALLNFRLVSLERGIGTAQGHITNAATGEPVAGARIASDVQDISFSEKDGAYTLKASPCAASVTLTASGFQTTTEPLSLISGGTTALDIALEPLTTCIVSGIVKNFLTGQPVAMAHIVADNGDATLTDDAGFYSLAIPSCTATLTICADGFFKTRRVIASLGILDNIQRDVNLIPCLQCRCDAAPRAARHDAR